jgi:hypothetical protein
MSDGLSCDRCGKTLLVDEEVRYTAELKVYAAYDVLEVTREELMRDRRDEIARLAVEIAAREQRALEDEVAWTAKLDLCPACARRFREDPLGRGRHRTT